MISHSYLKVLVEAVVHLNAHIFEKILVEEHFALLDYDNFVNIKQVAFGESLIILFQLSCIISNG